MDNGTRPRTLSPFATPRWTIVAGNLCRIGQVAHVGWSPWLDGTHDIRLVDLAKRYGEVHAVDGVTLDVQRGEFFTMLGPSGSGKTTTLRLIAGFELPDAGRVELAGADVSRVPPYARDVNTVFQDYALFPHMTVAENVAYGLRVRGVARADRRRRAGEALDMVRLPDVGARKPAQLSGGQRQRVALARAIVNRPRVLLLDEPLGALDLKLRQEMQVELKRIQSEVGITFVYVTHDQEEALTMSDRLAVFDQGRIVQVGAPAEVYERPATEFVAGFVGTSNVLHRAGRRFTVRPEKVRLLPSGINGTDADGLVVERGRVTDVSYVGPLTRYVVALDAGGELQVVRQNLETTSEEALGEQGREVRVAWREEHTSAIAVPNEEEGP
jgi:putative spermidine/putrescine transport system ATP-binding protein